MRFGWLAGVPFESKERISAIGMSYEDTEIRKYMLEYDSDSRRSKLANLYECAQQHCKHPTAFTYKQPVTFGFYSYVTPDFGGQGLAALETLLDADGDGINDVILNPYLDPANPQNCTNGRLFAHATGVAGQPYTTSGMSLKYDTCAKLTALDRDNDGRDEIYVEPTNQAQYVYKYGTNNAWSGGAIRDRGQGDQGRLQR